MSQNRSFIGQRLLELGERDFRLGRRLAEQRGDLLHGAHLLLDDLVGDLDGAAAHALLALARMLLLGDVAHDRHDDVVGLVVDHRLFDVALVFGQINALAAEHGVELPICEAVRRVLYENAPPADALQSLFMRSLKPG